MLSAVCVSRLPLFALRTHLWIMIERNENSAHTHTSKTHIRTLIVPRAHCIYFRLNKLWMHERMHVGNQQPVNLLNNIILHLICVVRPYFWILARSPPCTYPHPSRWLRCDTVVRWIYRPSFLAFLSLSLSLWRSCRCCVPHWIFTWQPEINSPTHYKFAWKIYGKLFSMASRKRWRDIDQKPFWFIECTGGSQWISLIQ